jgi:hypothetical protein
MKIKTILGFALTLCVAGCSSMTESQLHCTSLSREEQTLVNSDLNRLLVSKGLTRWNHEEPHKVGLWFAPLRKGNAEFTVSAYTNAFGMNIYVNNALHSMSARTKKALVEEIVQCVKSNAPGALVNIQVTKNVSCWSPFE